MRWSDSRTRASRTAANASKRRSSSSSPFSSRSRNSTVFAAQLVVGELLELGLERRDVGGLLGEALHAPALAEAKGLLECPSGEASGTGYRALAGHRRQRYRGSEGASPRPPRGRRRAASARTTYSAPSRLARALERPAREPERRPAVERQRAPLAGRRRAPPRPRRARAPRRPRSARRRRPTSRPSPHRLRAVGRRERRLDRVGERRDAVVRLVLLDEQRAVRSETKCTASPRSAGASAVATASQRRAAGRRGCPGSPRCSPSQPGGSAAWRRGARRRLERRGHVGLLGQPPRASGWRRRRAACASALADVAVVRRCAGAARRCGVRGSASPAVRA